MNDLFPAKYKYMKDNYDLVPPLQFYREIFPEGSFEDKGVISELKKGNGMLVYKDTRTGKVHTNIIFEDFKELSACISENDKCYVHTPFATMSMCSYLGRNRTNKNAFECFGMCIDVDDVDKACLCRLLYQAECGLIPMPTYISISGNGIHAYYVFDAPIHLTPAKFDCLNTIKNLMSISIWNSHTSLRKEVQFQGITQVYRIIGTRTKKGHKVTAFRTGTKLSIEDIISQLKVMNIVEPHRNEKKYQEVRKKMKKLVSDERVSFDMIAKLCYDADHLTLKQAQAQYPEWYQRRVVNKEPAKHWKSNIALYNWWLSQISSRATYGGRYYAIYGLTAFAQRCDVPYEQLENDALSLVDTFNSLSPDDDESTKFTREDVYSAINLYYTADLTRTTKKWLEKKVGFTMPSFSKRNGRSRETHLAVCRDLAAKYKELGTEYNTGGRPPKDVLVHNYLEHHPTESNVAKIARECGVSRNTVYKYFKQ